jgi:hypothetical protein
MGDERPCHCEERSDEANQTRQPPLDCFATLAMTAGRAMTTGRAMTEGRVIPFRGIENWEMDDEQFPKQGIVYSRKARRHFPRCCGFE